MDRAEVLFRTYSHGCKTIFVKKFDIQGRRTKLFSEKRFSEVHNHSLKFGTVTDRRSKKVSPVKRNVKETVKSRVDSNPDSPI